VLFENFAAILIDFHLKANLKSGTLESEVEPPDPGE